MENRHGLVAASEVTPADAYDTRDFVADIRFAGITPHVAPAIQARCRSAIHERTARHLGYGM